MDFHAEKIEAVLQHLDATTNGLSQEEAEKRRKIYGENVITAGKKKSLLLMFLEQFKEWLVILLIIAAAVAYLIGETIDAAMIMAIVILNAIFGFFQEYKAEQSIEALKKLAAPIAVVMRDGKKEERNSTILVPGDVIFIEAGMTVPADVRWLEAVNLEIDEAILTRESHASHKETNLVNADAVIADRKNMGFMGTLVTTGRGSGVVVATGMNTEIGKIAKLVQAAEERQTPLQHELEGTAKFIGWIVLGVTIAVVLEGLVRGIDLFQMFLTGVSLAVAAVPEGLPAIVTISLAIGMQRMAARNAIVRKLSAVETLGGATVICSDKTGTITKNEMTVTEVWVDDKVYSVTGTGYKPEGKFLLNGQQAEMSTDLKQLLRIGRHCNSSEVVEDEGTWKAIGDPTEAALVVAATKAGQREIEYKNIGEISFSSDRKRMTTIHEINHGSAAYTKGATEVVLELCTHILMNGRREAISPRTKEMILEQNRRMAQKALRVLGLAYRELPRGTEIKEDVIETGLTFVGLMGMIDPPREETKSAIELCKKAGIKVIMITGDNRETAVAVATEVGLTGKVVTGVELEKMSDEELERTVEELSVCARVSPNHKVRIVKALKVRGHTVSMTGDGVNDAPSLKEADIGVSMGLKGTDVAKEASNMVLLDDNFATLVEAVRQGRVIYDNIKKSIFYLISCNMAEVAVIFLALLANYPLPLLPVQILWMNLVTDGLPALALGMDPAEKNIMERKPRSRKEKILGTTSLPDILLTAAVMTVGTLTIFALDHDKQTLAFTTLVTFQFFHSLNSRSKTQSIFKDLFSNHLLIGAIVGSFILQYLVVSLPLLQPLFSTETLQLWEWGLIIGTASTIIIAFELKKWLMRRSLNQAQQTA